MKKIIYIIGFLISFSAFSQTPFPSGARFPNATKSDTLSTKTRIPIMQANSGNLINKYIPLDSISNYLTVPVINHANSHQIGGADEISGENLAVTVTPSTTGYTPTDSSLEGHLKGIDSTLVALASGAFTPATPTEINTGTNNTKMVTPLGLAGSNIQTYANNGQTAYSWGNHAGLYRPIGYVPAWAEITGKPSFGTVATTNDYNDLDNLPTIPNVSEWSSFTGTRLGGDLVITIGDYDDSGEGKKLIINNSNPDIPSEITGSFKINQGDLILFQGLGNGKLSSDNITSDRDIYLPDASGTIALQEWVLAQGYSTGSASVSDTAYGAPWNGQTTTAPSQNAAYDAINLRALKSNVLEKDNTTAFTPTADYHPATKKYVDDNIGSGSGHTIQDNGVSKTARTNLNFKNFIVDDNAANNSTDITAVVAGAPLTYNYTAVGAETSINTGVSIASNYQTEIYYGNAVLSPTIDYTLSYGATTTINFTFALEAGYPIRVVYNSSSAPNAITDTDDVPEGTTNLYADANATNQGNTFNGANQLVKLDGTGKLPAIDGSNLTNLPSGGSVEGTAILSTGETGGTKFLREDGDGTSSWQTISGGDMLKSENLSGLTNYTTARSNLGLVIGTNVLAPNGSASGLTDFPTLNQNTTGSAATLTTPRTINGTSFNGSANITTTNWGTSRNISIGGTSKAVTGGANVTWSQSEIGVNKTTIDALGINATAVGGVTVSGTPTTGQIPIATSGTTATWQTPSEVIQIACSDLVTDIATGTSKAYFRMPYAMTLTDVRVSLLAAGTVTGITVDINESGTTILSTKLTTDATEKTSTTAVTAAVISDASLADDSEITIDFDAVPTGGKGVIVTLKGNRI